MEPFVPLAPVRTFGNVFGKTGLPDLGGLWREVSPSRRKCSLTVCNLFLLDPIWEDRHSLRGGGVYSGLWMKAGLPKLIGEVRLSPKGSAHSAFSAAIETQASTLGLRLF